MLLENDLHLIEINTRTVGFALSRAHHQLDDNPKFKLF